MQEAFDFDAEYYSDRNKTPLTIQATKAVESWLWNCGVDYLGAENVLVVPEVPYGGTITYISDLMAWITPSWTNLSKLAIFDSDWNPYSMRQLFINVEVKTSRADFLKDVKGKFSNRYCHFDGIAYPWGMIKKTELPAGWWGIELSRNCTRVMRVHRGETFEMPPENAVGYACSLFLKSKYWIDYYAYRKQSRVNRDWERRSRELHRKEKELHPEWYR